ncbi:MAG: hypothetical protein LBK73_13715, partial [Treponema sp.]|nr:hypothetical protein [Treponema sp.]
MAGYKGEGRAFKEAGEARGVDSNLCYGRKERRGQTGSLEKRAPPERGGKANESEPVRSLGGRP